MIAHIQKVVLAASLVLSAGAAQAVTVTVSPGGTFTASGQAYFRLSGQTQNFGGNCPVTMQGTLNPANAAFTITSADFSPPCGTLSGGTPVGAAIDLPWSAPTQNVFSDGAYSYPVHLDGSLFQIGGDGPRWGAICQSSLAPPFSLRWFTNGLPGAASTRLSTNGYQMFGQNATSGSTCEIMFDLYLSPFQTFTKH